MEFAAEEIVAKEIQARKSKQRVVFGVNTIKKALYDSVEFYAFDEESMRIEDVGGESLDKRYNVIKIKDEAPIAQPVIKLDHCHAFASYASMGSDIFCVGGHLHYCGKCIAARKMERKLYDVNTVVVSPYVALWSACKKSWIMCFNQMNKERTAPHLHVLGDLLCAVGGIHHSDTPLFMEVFDRLSNRWIPLPDPPEVDYYFVSAKLGDSILLGPLDSESFYSYKPYSDNWERLDHLPINKMLLQFCTKLPAVVVDNHLVWVDQYRGTDLICFDLKSGNYFSINLGDEGLLPNVACRLDCPQLLHIGDTELVLIWRDKCLYVREGQTKGTAKDEFGEEQLVFDQKDALGGIHCTRFVIDFVKAQQGAQRSGGSCVRTISHQKCFVPDQPKNWISAAFVVDADMIGAVADLSHCNIIRKEVPRKRKRPGQVGGD